MAVPRAGLQVDRKDYLADFVGTATSPVPVAASWVVSEMSPCYRGVLLHVFRAQGSISSSRCSSDGWSETTP